ncbi:MAG: hypothetical protein BWZ10_02000 [candidate division BRC1 bacterium ADurb.BinA364]|nr:MAG: hypothetical protein BWZ10_02000 [candidate division BRC1 bacterium ADurb.BinA364]
MHFGAAHAGSFQNRRHQIGVLGKGADSPLQAFDRRPDQVRHVADLLVDRPGVRPVDRMLARALVLADVHAVVRLHDDNGFFPQVLRVEFVEHAADPAVGQRDFAGVARPHVMQFGVGVDVRVSIIREIVVDARIEIWIVEIDVWLWRIPDFVDFEGVEPEEPLVAGAVFLQPLGALGHRLGDPPVGFLLEMRHIGQLRIALPRALAIVLLGRGHCNVGGLGLVRRRIVGFVELVESAREIRRNHVRRVENHAAVIAGLAQDLGQQDFLGAQFFPIVARKDDIAGEAIGPHGNGGKGADVMPVENRRALGQAVQIGSLDRLSLFGNPADRQAIAADVVEAQGVHGDDQHIQACGAFAFGDNLRRRLLPLFRGIRGEGAAGKSGRSRGGAFQKSPTIDRFHSPMVLSSKFGKPGAGPAEAIFPDGSLSLPHAANRLLSADRASLSARVSAFASSMAPSGYRGRFSAIRRSIRDRIALSRRGGPFQMHCQNASVL